MEEVALARSDGIRTAVKKKRTQISRRPKDSNELADYRDHSSLSMSPPSDDVSKSSSGENAPKRKKFSINQLVARASSATGSESENAFSGSNSGSSVISQKRSTEGALAPVNWRCTSKLKECVDAELRTSNIYGGRNGESWSSEKSGESLDASGNESKVKKVKLKVGSVTRTVHSNSTTNGVSSTKNSQSSDTSKSRQKNSHQENIDEHFVSSKKRSGLQGVPWKDFSKGGFSLGKMDYLMGKTSSKTTSGKQGDKSEPVRKSKRLPKRRALGAEIDEDNEDEEIRYLEKLKLKVTTREKGNNSYDDESIKKQHKLSTMNSNGASRVTKDAKKRSKSDQASEDRHYKEELFSDSELEGSKTKKQKKESVESLMDGKRDMTLTTRQRALQSSKDGSSVPGSNLIEFPNGLPPAPPRKQKEKLSEVEQQLKKTEAAQRRRMQVEKAARESEAEAIRKILGQDSSRKKQEEKKKKRLEEMAEEKAASALTLASNTIRWVMGPTGTILTFPKDMGLPSIFDSKPSSYPPPREKCAGPSCTNPYRYRDSKSKLPLCSLQCYKAIHEQRQSEINC